MNLRDEVFLIRGGGFSFLFLIYLYWVIEDRENAGAYDKYGVSFFCLVSGVASVFIIWFNFRDACKILTSVFKS